MLRQARIDTPLGILAGVVVVTGLALAALLFAAERRIGEQLEGEAISAAQMSSEVFMSVALERDDYRAGRIIPAAYRELDISSNQSVVIDAVRVWGSNGELRHTTAGAGTEAVPGPAVQAALGGSSATALIEEVDVEGGPDVSVALPVTNSAGAPIETVEAIVPYGTAEGAIESRINGLRLLVSAIAIGLYAALLPILIRVARTLSSWHAARFSKLQREVTRALEGNEFELHYQPLLDLESCEIETVEALLRWRRPKRGLRPAEEFIAQIERTDAIVPLTEFVLSAALRQAADWSHRQIGLRIAVNVAPISLHDAGFPALVEKGLAEHGVDADRLTLELTERAVVGAVAERSLERLRELGVSLSIDDFGTGHSSLVRLDSLPIDELKIDRKLICRLGDRGGSPLVETMIDLAHRLGLRIVAEGVEDEAVIERAGELGCDAVQGWAIARAMPADELEAWIIDQRRSDSLLKRIRATARLGARLTGAIRP